MATKVNQFGATTRSGLFSTCKVGNRWYFYPNDHDWLAWNGNDSFSSGYGSQTRALQAAERFELDEAIREADDAD